MDKANLFNSGACGIEQFVPLGSVKFNTSDIATGVKIGALPKGFKITRLVCNVDEAFNAATTNVLVLGTSSDDDAFMGANDITEGSTGVNVKNAFTDVGTSDVDVYAKYTQTGTAATTGKATFGAFVMRLA